MANSGELLVSNRNGEYIIKVSGRATFDCAPPLRDLAKNLDQEKFTAIRVDLAACEWMDSTFMGVLAMLGLRAKKINAVMEICAASAQNEELLAALGLKKLFVFTQNAIENPGCENCIKGGSTEMVQAKEGAQTVLEAHQTLMDVDDQNVAKFEKVVDLVQMDIDRMNNDSE